MCLLAPRLVAVLPSISNIRCRENSKQNHKASCSKSGKSKNATENANAKNSATEKCKKNATSNVAFSELHILQLATLHFLPCMFFCNFDQRLYCFFYAKKKHIKMENKIQRRQNKCNRKCKKNATSNVALSELHFCCNLRRRIFLAGFFLVETCDIAFSNLLVFGKLLQQETCLGAGKLKKKHSQKMLCQDMALSQHHVSSTHPGREKKKLHGCIFPIVFFNTVVF